jgi:carbon monoxide dehydrogenase subunit G
MASVTNSVTIRRPIEDVFGVLTNVENTGKWFPGTVEEHWTSPAPHGVGSTRHAVATMFGRRTENDAVATEFQPPYRAVMEGMSPNAGFRVALVFARDGDGTRVEVTSEIRLRGAMRVLGPVLTVLYGRAWARGLARLKELMESGQLSWASAADLVIEDRA